MSVDRPQDISQIVGMGYQIDDIQGPCKMEDPNNFVTSFLELHYYSILNSFVFKSVTKELGTFTLRFFSMHYGDP